MSQHFIPMMDCGTLSRDTLKRDIQQLVNTGEMITKSIYKGRHRVDEIDWTSFNAYQIKNTRACWQKLYRYFTIQTYVPTFEDYCKVIAHKWLNEYKIVIFNNKTTYDLLKDLNIKQYNHGGGGYILLVPFLNMLRLGVFLIDLDCAGIQLDTNKYSNISQIFTQDERGSLIYGKTANHFSDITFRIFNQLDCPEIRNNGEVGKKRQAISIDKSLARALSRPRLLVTRQTQALIDAKCQSLGKQRLSLQETFDCTISAMHIRGLITIKNVYFGSTRLYAFRINDGDTCKHFFNKIFLSAYTPPYSRKPYVQPRPAQFLSNMYELWAKHLQFMIYNTPEFMDEGSRYFDTGAFYKTFADPELQRLARMYQNFDTVTKKPFDFLVPLPPLIKTGVVFFQVKPDINMMHVAVQKFKLSADRKSIAVNQHKETFINFLSKLDF